eukprot:6193825-Prymnesium_polylepis.1
MLIGEGSSARSLLWRHSTAQGRTPTQIALAAFSATLLDCKRVRVVLSISCTRSLPCLRGSLCVAGPGGGRLGDVSGAA